MVNAGLACLAHYCRMGGCQCLFLSHPIPALSGKTPSCTVSYRTVPAIQPYSHIAIQPHFSLSSILLLSFDSSSSPSFLLSHLHRYLFNFPSPFASSSSLSHPFPFSSSLPLSRWPGPSAKPHIHRYYYYPPLSSWNNLASTNGLSGENRQQNPIEP